MAVLYKLNQLLTRYFALWVVLIAVLAFYQPTLFLPVKPYIRYLLGLIMFGMGMTLQMPALKQAFSQPKPLLIGLGLQFAIMPLLGVALATLFALSPAVAAGLILVGACPGGTASNVMVYLARGNTALSIAMTTLSTLIAPIFTPMLMQLYAQAILPVDVGGLFISILQMVLLPVVLGLLVKAFMPKIAQQSARIMPAFSILAIMAIIACVVALNISNIQTMGVTILCAVVLHNLLGLSLGYSLAKLFSLDESSSRAIAIEVGMQNSGLAAVLAHTHFSALTALPSALFSIWHNLSGAVLATVWRKPD